MTMHGLEPSYMVTIVIRIANMVTMMVIWMVSMVRMVGGMVIRLNQMLISLRMVKEMVLE